MPRQYKKYTYSRNSARARCSAVPIGLGVTKTVTDSDAPVSELSQGGEHVVSQIISGLLVNIVADFEPGGSCGRRTALGDVALEPVLGVLDLVWGILVVVVGINIKISDVVAQCGHIRLALAGAARVRWTHVGRDFADNVAQSHFVLVHLFLPVSLGDGAQI